MPTGRPTPGTRAGGWCSPLPICRFPFCPGGVLLPCGAAKAWSGRRLAYGAIIGETAESLLGDEEPQEEIFQLLVDAYRLLPKRNKRLVTDSTLLKLLALCGLQPILDSCTSCNEPVTEDGFFSLVQGGFLCKNCALGEELPMSLGTRDLMEQLLQLDLAQPPNFTVRGRELMEMEKILHAFIVYQTDRPLHSLDFLAQMENTAHGQ